MKDGKKRKKREKEKGLFCWIREKRSLAKIAARIGRKRSRNKEKFVWKPKRRKSQIWHSDQHTHKKSVFQQFLLRERKVKAVTV